MRADLALLEAALPPDFPDGLREYAELFFMALCEDEVLAGLTPEQLVGVALRQVERLSDVMGGSSIYIQKGVTFRLSPRNREMCEQFRGDYKALARRYKLSEQQVRNVVDRWQRERFLERQHDMFGEPPARARQRKI